MVSLIVIGKCDRCSVNHIPSRESIIFVENNELTLFASSSPAMRIKKEEERRFRDEERVVYRSEFSGKN